MIELIKYLEKIKIQDKRIGVKEADNIALKAFASDEKERFYCLCKVYNYCSKELRAEIEEEIYKNWLVIDSYTVRLLIEEAVFKYDDFLRDAFITRIVKWNESDDIDRVEKQNPLICMIELFMYSILQKSELIKMEQYANNSRLLDFIIHTETFDIDDFNMDWSFLFRRREYLEIYKKMKDIKLKNIEEEERVARRKKYFG